MTGDRPPEHQGRLTGPCGGLDNWPMVVGWAQDAFVLPCGFWSPCSRLTRVVAFSLSYFLPSLGSRSGAIRATTRAERGELSLPAAQHFKSLSDQFRRPGQTGEEPVSGHRQRIMTLWSRTTGTVSF
jgi:hypothetical protein